MSVNSIQNSSQIYSSKSVSTAKETYTNSVWTQGGENIPNVDKNEILKKVENKVQELLKKYNITREELEEAFKNAGFTELHNLPVENLNDEKIQKMIEFLQQILEASKAEGKVDINKLVDNLKGKREHYNAIHKGIIGLLISKGLLSEEDRNNPQKLEAAVKTFLTQMFEKIKSSGKSSPEQIKAKIENFKLVLAATDDSDKVALWNAVKNILKEGGVIKEAITEMIKSFVTPENLQKFVGQISKEDLNKLGINIDDLTNAIRNLNDPQKIEQALNSIIDTISKFYKENNEILDICNAKVKEYKDVNNGENPTDEWLKANLTSEQYERFKICKQIEANLTGMFTGGTVAAVEHNVDIKPYMQQMQDILTPEQIQNVYDQINTYVEKHAESGDLKISKEDFNKILDDATKGEYTGNTEAYKNAEIQKEEKTSASVDFGYIQADTQPSEENKKRLMQEIAKTEDKGDNTPQFVIETPNARKIKITATTSAEDAINNYGYNTEIKSAFSMEKIAKSFAKISNSFYQKSFAKDVADQNEKQSINLINIGGNKLFLAVAAIKSFTDEQKKAMKNLSGIVKNSVSSAKDDKSEALS